MPAAPGSSPEGRPCSGPCGWGGHRLRVPHRPGRHAVAGGSCLGVLLLFAPDLPLNALPIGSRIKGGVRIRLKTTTPVKFSQMPIDRLCFFLTGRDDVANRAVRVVPRRLHRRRWSCRASRGPRWHELLPATDVRPVGFTDEEALLPVPLRSFQGYRLLQEYFAFPQRFRFFEVAGLARAAGAGCHRRDRAGAAVRPRRANSRERRRRVERVVVLHAGHQPVPAPRSIASTSPRARTSTTSCPTARGRWTSRCTR